MSSDKIKAWTYGALYVEPQGFSLFNPEGEIAESANAACTHSPQLGRYCRCGFITFSKRADAVSEAGAEPVIEVEHLRESVTVQTPFIRSLTQDMVSISFNPECYECLAPAKTLYTIETSSPSLRKTSVRPVQVLCENCAYGDKIEESAVSEFFGVPVLWEESGRTIEQMLLDEVQEVVDKAGEKIAIETMTEAFLNAERRAGWAKAIEYGDAEAFDFTVAILLNMDKKILMDNPQAVRELFEYANPKLLDKLRKLSFTDRGVDLIVKLLS